MMRFQQYILFTLATARLSLLLVQAAAPRRAQDEALVAATISNELGWKIFSCLSGSSSRHNLIFSPVSLSTSLAIMYYGALGNSSREIRCEISSLLQPSSLPSQCSGSSSTMKENKSEVMDDKAAKECYCPPGPYFKALLSTFHVYNTTNATIDIANGIWHHGNLHSLFKRNVNNYFSPELMTLHPKKPTMSASEINEWVNNITRGKISNVINAENIQESDKVFIFDVLYFRSLWATPFTADDYTKRFITCSACHGNNLNLTAEGSIDEVQFMEKEESVPYCEMSSLTAIRMPYTNNNISMTIILPKQLCTMRTTEDKLINSDLLQRINNCLLPLKVHIILPKFDLEQELPINSILSKLGLESLYYSSTGGFSTILQKSRNLRLSKVSHQSVLEVNEKGIDYFLPTKGLRYVLMNSYMFSI